MKLSTYKSLLTNRKTNLVLSIGKCGYPEYREAVIRCQNGKFYYTVTDGFKFLDIERGGHTNLKSLINIIEGKITLESLR